MRNRGHAWAFVSPTFCQALAIVVGSQQFACTFYTDCPCADEGSGGAAQSGGTSSGGSSGGGRGGTGGTGGEGGEPDPLPTWVASTGDLAGRSAACGEIIYLGAKPGDDMLVAGINMAGLYASFDGGGSWSGLGMSGDSELITNLVSGIVFDPEYPDVFWESGAYGAGVYRTGNNGETFEQLGDITHTDRVSIDFTDPDRLTLITGGHEQPQKFNRSQDGGDTWEDLGMNLPGDCRHSTYPLALSDRTFLIGCLNGILRTTDAGETWEPVSLSGGAGPPLHASNGAIYWTIEGGGGLLVSTDDGQEWTRIVGGGVLKGGLTRGVNPIELPDGRLASVSAGNYVVVSGDEGLNWEQVTAEFPLGADGLVYSAAQRAFYIWRVTCDGEIPEDAIMRADFDYETSL